VLEAGIGCRDAARIPLGDVGETAH
jgi:hypothetical protein